MASASVKWIQGKQFMGMDSTKHAIVLSTGDEGVGVKPSEMLLVALGACSSVDVVDILAKKRTPVSFLEVQVSGEQDQDPPWTYRKIHLSFRVGGEGLTDKAVAQAIHLSETKYCSVAATIRGVAEITTSFEIVGSDEKVTPAIN